MKGIFAIQTESLLFVVLSVNVFTKYSLDSIEIYILLIDLMRYKNDLIYKI